MDQGEKQASIDVLMLASIAFRYPNIQTAGVLTEFEVSFEAACQRVGVEFRPHPAPACTTKEILHHLRVEYTNLFLSLPHAQVSLYESAWIATQTGVRALPFANNVARMVKEQYRNAGLEPADRREPADHIAFELEFAAQLISRGKYRTVGDFLHSHLLNWADEMCAKVCDTSEGFYATIATVLPEALAAIADMMDMPDQEGSCKHGESVAG